VLRGGISWRMLPHDLPPWKSIYHYFRLWRLDGTWEHINDVLTGKVRQHSGREATPSAGIMDSQSVKTTEKATVLNVKVAGHQESRFVDV
jgi:putative transposase